MVTVSRTLIGGEAWRQRIAELRRWNTAPAVNRNAVENARKLANSLLKEADPGIGGNADTAMDLLGLLEVPMASLNRYERRDADAPDPIPHPAMELAERLAEQVAHPPRGSHLTQWCGRSMHCYTDLPNEQRFADTVRHARQGMRSICDLLRALVHDPVSLEDPAAAKALQDAAETLKKLRSHFTEMISTVRIGADRSDWFHSFRQFLAPIPWQDRSIAGPNPANLAEWPEMDLLLGLGDAQYRGSLQDRLSDFLPCERARIASALHGPTLRWVIARRSCNHQPHSAQLLSAYSALCKHALALSGAHWGAIVFHLDRTAAHTDGDWHISPEVGVSGRDLRDTREQLSFRRAAFATLNQSFARWQRPC